jgi:thioesterase domain-containing protein
LSYYLFLVLSSFIEYLKPQQIAAGPYRMTAEELEAYLHKHIPLSAAMEVSVVSASLESVTLRAPLGPNINHRETVFGGSANALAILSAWSLVRNRLVADGIACKIVIHKNTMSYDCPIDGEFSAVSRLADPDGWQRFVRMFRERGKSRIKVESDLWFEGKIAGRFEGKYVALA